MLSDARLRSPRAWVAGLLAASALVLLLRAGVTPAATGAFLAAHLPAAQAQARASTSMDWAASGSRYGDYWKTDPETAANQKKAAEMRAAYDARNAGKLGKQERVTVTVPFFGKRSKIATPEVLAALAEQEKNFAESAKLRAAYEAASAANPKKGLWGTGFEAVKAREDANSPEVQAALKLRSDFEARSGGKAIAGGSPAAVFKPPPLTENQKKAFPR